MRYGEAASCAVAAAFICLLLVASGCNSGANPAGAARQVDLTAIDLPGTEDPELSVVAKEILDVQGLFLSRRLLPDSVWQGHRILLEAKTSAYYPSAFAYWLLAGTARALSDVPADTEGLQALNAAKKAVKLAPKSACAHSMLGELYCYRGEMDKSVTSCEEAAHLAPDSVRTQLLLGCTLHECGRLEDAANHLEKATGFDPAYPRAQYHLGCAYGELKRYFRAVEVLEEATRLEPDYLEAYWFLGNLHKEKKRWDRAADAYLEVIRVDAKRPKAHSALAGAYYEDGKYKKAIRAGRKATQLDRYCAWGRYYVGMSYLRQGNVRRAATELKRALEYSELRSELYWLARNALLEVNPPRSSSGG